nr:putative LRR receptor-like protein kinase [Tanacetum cinerariifolium]
SKFFILNTKDYLTKFDPKSYEGVFIGYLQNSKAYIILNKQTMKVKESFNVALDETPPLPKTSPMEDDDLVKEESIEELVPNPMDMTIIETEWVYKNKLDKNGVVTRNIARLVSQGYNQHEEIDYDETYEDKRPKNSKFFILNTKDYLTKFDPKSYEGVFIGYLQNSKAYIILNKQTMKVKESFNVTFDETPPLPKTSPMEDDDLVKEESIEVNKTI